MINSIPLCGVGEISTEDLIWTCQVMLASTLVINNYYFVIGMKFTILNFIQNILGVCISSRVYYLIPFLIADCNQYFQDHLQIGYPGNSVCKHQMVALTFTSKKMQVVLT
jgi:hypothetical protein